MSALTNDTTTAFAPASTSAQAPLQTRGGLVLALISALAFGTSGTLAHALMQAGWTPGAVVLARLSGAALLLLPFGLIALRGRWSLLRRYAPTIVAYGVFAVALMQFAYYAAITRLPVGVALLIEYASPVAVITWMWLRHGHRPTRLTLIGGVIAVGGLVLLLDLGGAGIDPVGAAWAGVAMIGAAAYFVISANSPRDLPPITLAAAGLSVGIVVLGSFAALGVIPLRMTTSPARFASAEVPSWVVVAALVVIAGAVAYVTGIASGRRLGARLASFVALGEVVAATGFAWLLLAQVPAPIQLIGAPVLLVGVVVVRLGEPRADRRHVRTSALNRSRH